MKKLLVIVLLVFLVACGGTKEFRGVVTSKVIYRTSSYDTYHISVRDTMFNVTREQYDAIDVGDLIVCISPQYNLQFDDCRIAEE